MSGRPLVAEVLVNDAASAEEEQAVIELFDRLGVQADARRSHPHRDPGTLGWLILVALPLQGFLIGLGNSLAEDLHGGLRKLVDRALRRPRNGGSTAPLVLQDSESGLRIVLEAGLPEEAFRQLTDLDLGGFAKGSLRYDQALHQWRAELDEPRA